MSRAEQKFIVFAVIMRRKGRKMQYQFENRMVITAARPGKKRRYVTCSRCGNPIYQEDDMNYGDDCYEIDGEYYCDDCIADAARDIFRVSI